MIRFRINRLIITKDGENVYDENFHPGINIIRGENGSGKSTIANALFFSIGGEFTSWLPEILRCDYTIVEVTINDSTLTFRREINVKSMRGMEIFHGSLEKAQNSAYKGWKVFGYRRSENRQSFSQYLFEYLNIPEIRTEKEDAITLNQIYRLIYIDQLSSISSLLNNEDFDSPLVRQAIGALMFGTFQDELYSKQIEYRKKKKLLDETNSEFKFLTKVIQESGAPSTIKKVNQLIEKKEKEIKEIEIRIDKIENSQKINLSQLSSTLNDISKDLTHEKKEYQNIISSIYSLELDLIDSSEFIEELETRLTSLEESLGMRKFYHELPVNYCPACLSKLEKTSDEHCSLCKEKIEEIDGSTRLERMKIEIKNQISESEQLYNKKQEKLQDLLIRKNAVKNQVNLKEKEYSAIVEKNKSEHDRVKDELFVKKGKLSEMLVYYNKNKDQLMKLKTIEDKLSSYSGQVKLLEEQINSMIEEQKKNEKNARNAIEKIALYLLNRDGGYEELFKKAKKLDLDFSRNTFYVDKRNQFSASSMVYLKNAVRFAIFFASLNNEHFRYPRFIICDNVEDKGMQEVRSHIFQKNIVHLANQFDTNNYQIIYTSSMVNPEFNNEKYTIGEQYGPNNKSLNV